MSKGANGSAQSAARRQAPRRAHQSISGSSDVPLSAAQDRSWSVFPHARARRPRLRGRSRSGAGYLALPSHLVPDTVQVPARPGPAVASQLASA